MEAAATTMLERHRANDTADVEPTLAAKTPQRHARLTHDAEQLRDWLATNTEDRQGARSAVRKSHRTDHDSAKLATSKGVIQVYTGVAAVDASHQIIVVAQVHGTGSEQELLAPIVEALQPLRGATTLIIADSGYHSEANLRVLDAMSVEALIADRGLRQHDERFATQARHRQGPQPLHDKTATSTTPTFFTPTDFTYDAAARTCVCPAGKSLYRSGGEKRRTPMSGRTFVVPNVTVSHADCAQNACGRPTPRRCTASRSFMDAPTPTSRRTPRA